MTPCVYRKVDAQREDGYPRSNDRASALSSLARSSIETWQPDSRPVTGMPVNHSRLRESFDKVTGTRPEAATPGGSKPRRSINHSWL